jgi:competence protein ComEA
MMKTKSWLLGLALVLGMTAAWAGVDVNKATQSELESVKGVGPALSGRILTERQKATFKDWSDLIDRVQGVGKTNAARLSEAGLTVGTATYAAPAIVAKAGGKTPAK